MSQSSVSPRSQVPVFYTWNAPSVFESEDAWELEFKALSARVPELRTFQGRLAEGADVLAQWLEGVDEVLRRARKCFVYAYMSQAADTSNQAAGARVGKIQGLWAQIVAAVSFTDPELLAIGRATLRSWMLEEPSLAVYDHYFDDLFRQQAHVRSQEVEELLGHLADPFASIQTTADLLTSADMVFGPAETQNGQEMAVAQGSVEALLESPDRQVRRTAWESYADAYLALKNTLANNLILSVKRNVFLARARRYGSALEASLGRDNIPAEVIHNLLETFQRHLPVWHRYWTIRRRALGVETLHPYDIWAPLAGKRPQVSYEQAVAWVVEGLAPLGRAYVDVVRRGCLEDRWVDVFPNQGKVSGAFSFGSQGTFPFIMMNFTESLEGLSTLAHELGHSMHSHLTWKRQPYVYSHYSLFAAEIASNFNQALVRDYLLRTHDDPDFQIALIEEAMANFHRYFFIMPTLARFELEVHRRVETSEGLNSAEMNSLMADLFEEGYGGQMQVDRERVGITWAQFSHLYQGFYVYQYATGISGAHALARRVLADEKNAVADYLTFLSAGSSQYALDLVRAAGVDLSTPDAVEETFGVLDGMVDRLEGLVEARNSSTA